MRESSSRATKLIRVSLSLVAGLLACVTTQADTIGAECGFSDSAKATPDSTSSCTFSQRQGFISVRIDGGQEFEFSPVGDSPGNYEDQGSNAIYRLSGLGKAGQIFKLPDTYLYVYWHPYKLDCQLEEISAPGQCALHYQGVDFEIQATTGSSINQLRIQPSGLAIDNRELSAELDGTAYRAELADLDSNGWPEVYVYISSAGSGSYGSLVAYAVNNGKTVSPIFLTPMDHNPQALVGYMGHDEFTVVENRLVRRFPIYTDGDTNAAASGGTRQLQYRLVPGEAGWLLEVDRIVEY